MAASRRRSDLEPCSAWMCCSDGGAEAGRKWSSPSREALTRERRGKRVRATRRETRAKVAMKGDRLRIMPRWEEGAVAEQASSEQEWLGFIGSSRCVLGVDGVVGSGSFVVYPRCGGGGGGGGGNREVVLVTLRSSLVPEAGVFLDVWHISLSQTDEMGGTSKSR